MKNTIVRLNATGVRSRQSSDRGRPVTEDFTKEIGAEGYSEDAAEAVNSVKSALRE